ncbi:MAG: GNAT family N-acetyltransferase [Thermoguttaceae bacterium]
MPPNCWMASWNINDLPIHSEILYKSFRNDVDALVFPTFQNHGRCTQLMEAVSSCSTFLPEASCLIAHGDPDGLFEYVAGIQGHMFDKKIGGIQNVAVLPEYRRRGIGLALVLCALRGFQQAGIKRVTLEATAENNPALKLYHKIGFQVERIYFREFFHD